MKKYMKYFMVLALALMLAACGSSQTKSPDFGYANLEGKTHPVKEVDAAKLEEMNNNKETYYLMIGRPSCPHCVDAVEIYVNITQEKKLENVYYFSFEDMFVAMSENKMNDQQKKDYAYLEKAFKFEGATPSFYYVKEGKVSSTADDVVNANPGLGSWQEVLDLFFENTLEK